MRVTDGGGAMRTARCCLYLPRKDGEEFGDGEEGWKGSRSRSNMNNNTSNKFTPIPPS